MTLHVDTTEQLPFFNLGPHEEPDTWTKTELFACRVTFADPPPTWSGRPYENIQPTGEWL
jgi:hypothetical protein